MAGNIEIRDSDDEDSDDVANNPPLPAAAISSMEIGNVDLESSAPKHLQHSGEPSTASTELLSREIEAACKSLLEPTPDGVRSTAKPRSSSRQLSSSPAVSRLKSRRATTNFADGKEKRSMITYSRASQDDSAHFKSSSSGVEYSPKKRAQLATELQGVQEQDTSPQLQDQPQCTPIEASVHPDFPTLADKVPSPTMPGTTPYTGQCPMGLDQNRAKSRKRLSSQMDQPESCFQKQNDPIPNDSSLSPKKTSRQEDDDAVNSFEDELSISLKRPPAPSNAKSKLSKSTRNQQEGGVLPTDGPGSDEIFDSLPAEQYKPRPSRSRSGHGGFDILIPADFSERPERTAKRKKTRRKTTAFEHPIHDSDEDREIVQTRNPVVIIETRNNMESTSEAVENLSLLKTRNDHLTEVQDGEPVTKSVPSNKKRRLRRKAPESTEELDVPNAETEDFVRSPEPKYSDETSPSKSVRKKRKLSPEPPPHNVSDSESCEDDLEPKTGPCDRNTIFKELKDKSNLRLASPPSTKCTSELPSPIKASVLLQTPQKLIKGPDKHSPLASSKVAYRVGLSKKARIEPLLRIVRK